MEWRRCAACEQAFRPRSQVPQQQFCGKAACQRERRRRWQQRKRQGDEDYRANQAQAQRIRPRHKRRGLKINHRNLVYRQLGHTSGRVRIVPRINPYF